MGTVAEQILGRLADLERQVGDIQLAGDAVPITTTEISRTLEQLRTKVDQIEKDLDDKPGNTYTPDGFKTSMSPKDTLPSILSDQFRDIWRLWSYKARDHLALYDDTLRDKLESIESIASPLTPEFIESMNISPKVNATIKRMLVHRLEGEPAEVVRSVAQAHGLEQYRMLAQLCDPSAGGRNWVDVQRLHHPSPAPNMHSLLSKIAEWKSLEVRVKARSGGAIPPTLRILALINLCPEFLQKRLYDMPEVATGKATFAEVENLITLAVHRSSKSGINSMEPTDSHEDSEVEIGGELFKLELKNGRRTATKVARPGAPGPKKSAKEFKGKCYKCDRVGHRRPDCTYSTKADGSPCNDKPTPAHALDSNVPKEVDQACLDVVELSLFDVVDPWTRGADPWTPEPPLRPDVVKETVGAVGPDISRTSMHRHLPRPPIGSSERFTLAEWREFEQWLCTPISSLTTPPSTTFESPSYFAILDDDDDDADHGKYEMVDDIVFTLIEDVAEVLDWDYEIFDCVPFDIASDNHLRRHDYDHPDCYHGSRRQQRADLTTERRTKSQRASARTKTQLRNGRKRASKAKRARTAGTQVQPLPSPVMELCESISDSPEPPGIPAGGGLVAPPSAPIAPARHPQPPRGPCPPDCHHHDQNDVLINSPSFQSDSSADLCQVCEPTALDCTVAGIQGPPIYQCDTFISSVPLDDGVDFWDAQSTTDDDGEDQDSIVDLMAFEGLERGMDITVDSGAGAPVANPKHFPGVQVLPSEASKRGQQFQGPGGDLIPNQGNMAPEVLVEVGRCGPHQLCSGKCEKASSCSVRS